MALTNASCEGGALNGYLNHTNFASKQHSLTTFGSLHSAVCSYDLTDHDPDAYKEHAKNRVYPLEGHSLPFVVRVNKSASSLREKVRSVS